MAVFHSDNLNIHFNLAVEELLLDRVALFGPTLFLWRAGPAVVIGKNQNPWRECRMDRVLSDGVALARRVSGGGAVYHDPGNLNFSLVLPRARYDQSAQFKMIRRALHGLGLNPTIENRSSVAVDGFKISGNAFCYRKDAAMHHGTLLVEADLERLGRYLEPAVGDYRTRAIGSVRARVANLASLRPDLDRTSTSAVIEAVYRETYRDWDLGRKTTELHGDELDRFVVQHTSREWLFGRTPYFAVEYEVPNGSAALRLLLEVEQGRVSAMRCDPFPGTAFEPLLARLLGCRFDAPTLAERLLNGGSAEPAARILAEFLAAQSFRSP